jgi:hypothetical protein
MSIENYKMLNNVILSVTFISVFIGIFFFTYGKTVEKEIVLNNLTYTIDGLTSTFSLLPHRINQEIKNKIKNIKLPNMDDEDEKTNKANIKLRNNAAMLLGGCFILCLIISFILAKYIFKNDNENENKNFLNFFTNEFIFPNLILLLGIAITEFLFLNCVIRSFIAADLNIIYKSVIELFKKNE